MVTQMTNSPTSLSSSLSPSLTFPFFFRRSCFSNSVLIFSCNSLFLHCMFIVCIASISVQYFLAGSMSTCLSVFFTDFPLVSPPLISSMSIICLVPSSLTNSTFSFLLSGVLSDDEDRVSCERVGEGLSLTDRNLGLGILISRATRKPESGSS